jgi:hypothetical protein
VLINKDSNLNPDFNFNKMSLTESVSSNLLYLPVHHYTIINREFRTSQEPG